MRIEICNIREREFNDKIDQRNNVQYKNIDNKIIINEWCQGSVELSISI